MQRTLLLTQLAALCCLQPLAANAQSQATLYGSFIIGAVHYGGYAPGQSSLLSENNIGSRLGLRGNEDLGDGLRALYTIEAGIGLDTGSGGIATREASVGLQSRAGTLRLGYLLTPLDDLHGIAGPGYKSNVMNDNLPGFWANGYSNSFTGASAGGTVACAQAPPSSGNADSFAFDNRYGNSLRYDSPELGGFVFASHLALGETPSGSPCNSKAWSSKLQYNAQTLTAALAYNLHHEVRGAGLDDHILMLAAGGDVRPWLNIGAYWQRLRYANPGHAALAQSGYGLRLRTQYTLHTLELGWYRAGAGEGEQTPVFSGIHVGPGTQSSLAVLGYRYSLSKRTQLWSQYARLYNGEHARYDLGGAPVQSQDTPYGQQPHAFGLGLRHDF
jgi:predicted porin